MYRRKMAQKSVHLQTQPIAKEYEIFGAWSQGTAPYLLIVRRGVCSIDSLNNVYPELACKSMS